MDIRGTAGKRTPAMQELKCGEDGDENKYVIRIVDRGRSSHFPAAENHDQNMVTKPCEGRNS